MPPPAAPSVLYTDRAAAQDVLSAEGVDARLDDDQSAVVEVAEEARLDRGAAVATAVVNRYCQPRYDSAQLASSWSVWEWASILFACWLCQRRGNPVPKDLAERRKEVLLEMKEVRDNQAVIEDIELRSADGIGWSNVTVNPLYRGRKVRVQRWQSDGVRRDLPVHWDWRDEYTPSEEW